MTAQARPTPAGNPDFMARRDAAVPRGLAQAHPLCVARARNAEVWDIEGRRYIDFCGGIAVVNTGHCHPKVIEAVTRQTALVSHTCFQVLGYEPYLRLAERLNALAPSHLPQKTLLMSTGAEAVENAIKIARAFTGRPGIIAFEGGFHGRTLLALALTGKVDPYKRGFGPFPADVFHAPYPCALHGVSVDDAIDGVERLFKTSIEPARVAAFIVEPVQGEGGYYPAPAMFLQRLRALADELDILLVADEVQTGIGRTGELFAIEHSGVVPDLITLAKGLGGGFPVSAVVGRADVMDAADPGGLGSTFAGNPLACAAALAVLDVVEDEGLCERAGEIGRHLLLHLGELARRHRAIAEVRGLGAMVALELCEDGDPRRPAPALTRALIAEARERGLLLLACGRYGNVVRLMMPLTIEQGILDEGLDILATALEAVAVPS